MKRVYTISVHTMILSEVARVERVLVDIATEAHGVGSRIKERPRDGGIGVEWQMVIDSEDCLNTPIMDAIRAEIDRRFTLIEYIQCRRVRE